MKRALFALLVLLLPAPVLAAIPTYTGNHVVPVGAKITITGAGAGCLTTDSSGNVIAAACPSGTAAFSAGTNITITGTNPYTISAPSVLALSGGTVTGSTTFSGPFTVSSGVPTISGVNAQLTFSSENNGLAMIFNTTNAHQTSLGPDTSGTLVQGVSCGLLSVGYTTIGDKVCFDTAGDAGFSGNVTATVYNIASKRAWKQDIHPLSLDALQVLSDTCWSSYRYRPQHGDPTQTHIGFIADCAPSLVSGPKHDHFDLEAVVTVDSLAILQLESDVKGLVILLCVVCLAGIGLCIALGMVACAKNR